MKEINAKGLLCPQPLILTKKEVENSNEKDFLVIVDNETAVSNLEKFAKNSNLSFNFEKKSENEFHIFITKNENSTLKNPEEFCQISDMSQTVIAVSKDFMGNGSEQLGKILIKGFIYTVSEYEKLPKTMIFFNAGVKLTTEGSPCIDDLKKLEEKGVEIISCGTCLDYYELKEKLLVGQVSNMYTIYETLFNSSKVISI
ncbi:MAG: sulfurtransferase-like selenium metabolism protein YedF [Peptoniphilaceae bacterium]|uniref:sulfurtransferase-like selenium metabolism protein YedF n=1 Tax=Parvimonas sp. TaxID=1944660 RepID=UPI0025FC384E|nr:sulfurtransferase-like selenium metabolism protein YedF [Parvimonas sp.]MCI5997721.1 sulfurtransferase-like selenium metabolism protein YedF [Parvimonas sp.]MDD7765577.1 sulfurtransferase-like selenium metabolism protein YedF [Peptoniphilaceae bacterium]MDY3051118.1 sulfurtransferase-like selenium metabolism protein YedF [Parvimonas sp.]